MLSSISVADFMKKGQQSNIIDIRSGQSYNNNHIPGAKNVSFEKLILYPEKYLNRNEVYYIYCQKGTKGAKAAQILRKRGYTLVNIEGGYENWVLET